MIEFSRASAEERKEIVIVGGGYVGFYSYRSIVRQLGNQISSGAIGITLIDPDTAHTFHGFSGEQVSGVLSPDSARSPFREIFSKAKIIRGFAARIDEENRVVKVRRAGSGGILTVNYDHLILGLGVTDRCDAISGLATHGLLMRSSIGPAGLRAKVLESLEDAASEQNPERRASLLSFVIAGGGFTGVEIAASIAELIKSAKPNFPELQNEPIRISLIHNGTRVLPEIEHQPALVDYATESLLELGVSIRCGLQVVAITPNGAQLNNGDFLRAHRVISTVGTKVTTIPGCELWNRDESGRVLADTELRRKGSRSVWIGGDGASVTGLNGQPNQPNAIWAIKHGKHIGKNIARELTGQPLHPFSYPGLGIAASVGLRRGLVELKGIRLTGAVASLLRIGFFLRFLPSKRRRVKTAAELLLLPLVGRRLSFKREAPQRWVGGAAIPIFQRVGATADHQN